MFPEHWKQRFRDSDRSQEVDVENSLDVRQTQNLDVCFDAHARVVDDAQQIWNTTWFCLSLIELVSSLTSRRKSRLLNTLLKHRDVIVGSDVTLDDAHQRTLQREQVLGAITVETETSGEDLHPLLAQVERESQTEARVAAGHHHRLVAPHERVCRRRRLREPRDSNDGEHTCNKQTRA